ncbi:MAG TPA: tyrosine-type recombinase/integrase [Microthrixaceae bacterium]|nr:tyrosine-type recombinase/integrase [Microthrixaceae bacterium]
MRGSVMKRGSTWTYVVSLGRDASGKKQQKWVGGHRTKAEAEDALVATLERMRTGMFVDPGTVTVGEYLTEWLEATSTTVLDSTMRNYEQMLRLWVVPRIGTIRLADLSPMHLRQLNAALLANGRIDGQTGLSARSVASCRRTLKKALNDAVRWGLLARNPMDVVDAPKVNVTARPTWNAEEARRFLGATTGHEWHAMWVLFLTTGMRRGEVAGLKWDAVDLNAASLAVQLNCVSVGQGGKVSEHTPKTKRGQRSIALDAATVDALRLHRKVQLEERLRLGEVWIDSGFVFCGPDGSPLHPDTLTSTFSALRRKVDVPRITLHDLRHTSATLALKAGVHPKVVSERLGHATVSITLDLYSHVIDDMQSEAAEQIGALLFG